LKSVERAVFNAKLRLYINYDLW